MENVERTRILLQTRRLLSISMPYLARAILHGYHRVQIIITLVPLAFNDCPNFVVDDRP
jgi:hypothetical protein